LFVIQFRPQSVGKGQGIRRTLVRVVCLIASSFNFDSKI